jgi:ATP-dependent Clp protease protease subunit
MPPWLAERLFDQRIVFLTGPVTPQSASTAAATLLTLDAMDAGGTPTGFSAPGPATAGRTGRPEVVYLHVAAPDGDLGAVFTVIDAIDSMRAPVYAVATGEVGGAAVGVLAAAHRRLAYPHARFRLAEPSVADLKGTADDVAAAAGSHLRALEDLLVRVAQATGQPRSRVEDDFSAVRLLDAVQARDYGLIDEVRSRS